MTAGGPGLRPGPRVRRSTAALVASFAQESMIRPPRASEAPRRMPSTSIPFSREFFDDPLRHVPPTAGRGALLPQRAVGLLRLQPLRRRGRRCIATPTGSRPPTASTYEHLTRSDEFDSGDLRAAHHEGPARAHPLPQAGQPVVHAPVHRPYEPLVRRAHRPTTWTPSWIAREFDLVGDFAGPVPGRDHLAPSSACPKPIVSRSGTGPTPCCTARRARRSAGTTQAEAAIAQAHVLRRLRGRQATAPGRRHALGAHRGSRSRPRTVRGRR